MPGSESEDFRRVERNLFEYAFGSGINGTGVVRAEGGALCICSSLAIPALNLAYLKTDRPEGKALDNIELFFREHGNPYTIWLPNGETVSPTLVERGLDHCTDLRAMIADLDDGRRELRPPAGCRLRSVYDEIDLDAFADAAFNGFEMPNDIWDRFSGFLRNIWPSQHPKNELVIATKADEPVASGLMFRGKSDIGLYWISVVPDQRRQGLGAWLTQELLRIGRDEGYWHAVLQSSPAATGLYRRLGFREVGSFQVYSH